MGLNQLRLGDVYAGGDNTLAVELLYSLLKERTPDVNISHVETPGFAQHQRFVLSRPYHAWYVVIVGCKYVGAVYLTKINEIGVFILKEHHRKGYGLGAVVELMALHPREKYLANTNPDNFASMQMFQQLGFNHIQNTLRLGT